MLHIDFESTKILKGAPLYVTQFENRVFTLVNFLKTILLSIFHNIIIKVVAASSGFCLLVYKMHLLFARVAKQLWFLLNAILCSA